MSRSTNRNSTLWIVCLEDRTVPAQFTVNTLHDTLDNNAMDGQALDAAGKTSLRAAIEEANRTNEHDTIAFDMTAITAEAVAAGGGGLPTVEQGPGGNPGNPGGGNGGGPPTSFSIVLSKMAGYQDVEITKNLTITGPGASVLTITRESDPTVPYRLITIGVDCPLTISGLTLQGGDLSQGAGNGGAIDNWGNLAVLNCTLKDNKVGAAGVGGAINNIKSLYVFGSTITNNSAPNGGGGIHLAATTSTLAHISYSSITNNISSKGGAIAVLAGAQCNIDNSEINYNFSTNIGGGIYTSGGNLTMVDSTLIGNTGLDGGGLYNSGGTSGFYNTRIESNVANKDGGALWAKHGSTTIFDSCNFAGNHAVARGSIGVYTGILSVQVPNCTGVTLADFVQIFD